MLSCVPLRGTHSLNKARQRSDFQLLGVELLLHPDKLSFEVRKICQCFLCIGQLLLSHIQIIGRLQSIVGLGFTLFLFLCQLLLQMSNNFSIGVELRFSLDQTALEIMGFAHEFALRKMCHGTPHGVLGIGECCQKRLWHIPEDSRTSFHARKCGAIVLLLAPKCSASRSYVGATPVATIRSQSSKTAVAVALVLGVPVFSSAGFFIIDSSNYIKQQSQQDEDFFEVSDVSDWPTHPTAEILFMASHADQEAYLCPEVCKLHPSRN